MTDTQTEQLTGRALDAAVAERVMGHKALAHAQTPFYSRDIADAWLVHQRISWALGAWPSGRAWT